MRSKKDRDAESTARPARTPLPENLYKLIFNSLQDVVIVADTERTIINANEPALRKVFGYDLSDVIGRSTRMLYAAEEGYVLTGQAVFERSDAARHIIMEVDFRRKKGDTFKGELYCLKLVDSTGSVVGNVGAIRDVTRTRYLETSLHHSQERYATLVQSIPHGIQENDLSGRITFSNRAYHKLTGYDDGELTGKFIWDLVADSEKESLWTYLKEIVASQPPPVPYVIRNVRKDGRVIDVQVDWDYVRDRDGRLVGFTSVITDITERRRAERIMEESERKFRAIFDNAIDGILLADLEEKKFFIGNKTILEMLGYGQEEIQNLGVLDIHPEEELPYVIDQFERQSRKEFITAENIPVKRRDGSIFFADINSSPVQLGDRTYLMGIFRDITERKVQDELLRRIADEVSLHVGEAFFESMVTFLCQSLGTEYAFIGRTDSEKQDVVKTLAVSVKGQIVNDFEYELANSPCQQVIGRKLCIYTEGVQALFPRDHMLREMGIESYAGMPLASAKGEPLGILVVMDSSPLKNRKLVETMLRIFAARAASELERVAAEEKLGHYADRLKTLNEIDQEILAASSVREICDAALGHIHQLIPCQHASIVRFDLTSHQAHVLAVSDKGETTLPADETLTLDGFGHTEALKQGKISIVDDISAEGQISEIDRRLLLSGIRSYVNVPLTSSGELIGSLNIGSDRPRAFDEEQVSIAEELSHQVAIAIQQTRQTELTKKERDKAQKLLDIAGVMIIALGADEKVTLANRKAADILDHPAEEIVGKNWFDTFIPAADRREVRAVFAKLMSGQLKPMEYFENNVLTRSGEKRLIAWHNSMLHDDRGVITGTLSSGEDVSERKRLEEQLRQVQKMEAIGQLAGGVAHDFNNLLTAIVGYGTLIRSRVQNDDLLAHNMDQILAITERGAHLTQSLLAFSRKQVVDLKPVSLNNIVARVSTLLPRLIGEDIEVATELSGEDPIVLADSTQIEQALMNFASNSRDAMPEGGTLTFKTDCVEVKDTGITEKDRKAGAYGRLSVLDTGTGMDKDTLKRIFDPFFTTKPVGTGTGLGLAAVYGLIQQHGGFIDIMSTPGHGTEIRVLLPRVSDRAEDRRSDEKVPARGHETLLLAEDEPAVRSAMAEVLRNAGYIVIEASNGREAVRKYREQKKKIDLLILDVVMPGMDGRRAYEKIRKTSPDMRVIFMSGYTYGAMARKGILPEGVNFMAKPIMPNRMLAKIREVMDH